MKVSIVKCPDYDLERVRDAVRKTFDLLGGVDKFIRKGMRVAIKPNLIAKKKPEEAATTHPAVIRAIVDIVKEAGATPFIIDSPGGPYIEPMLKSIYSASGLEAVAKDAGIKLNYDLSTVEIENPQAMLIKRLSILKPLKEADFIISVSKLKTHGQMVYTGAVKNMFGAIPGTTKIEFHLRMAKYDQFANALIDIHLAIKPGLNIMDAVVGMDGDGPSSGDPRPIGVIMGSEDPFKLDLAAVHVVNGDPTGIPVLKHAVARGLCPERVDAVKIVGEKIADVRIRNFNMPLLDKMHVVQYFDSGPMKRFVEMVRPRPVFKLDLCISCGKCAQHCPAKVITMTNGKPVVDLSGCIRCFCCAEFCPVKAVVARRLPLILRLPAQFFVAVTVFVGMEVLLPIKKRMDRARGVSVSEGK